MCMLHAKALTPAAQQHRQLATQLVGVQTLTVVVTVTSRAVSQLGCRAAGVHARAQPLLLSDTVNLQLSC